MVNIPGGKFRYQDKTEIQVSAFSMDATEVTVEAYTACVKSGKCTEPDKRDRCNYGVGDREDHPINCVDWHQATKYCEQAGKRLPTEEEWEYAARGTEGRNYPWGNEAPRNQLCWNGMGNRKSTCPVGSYPEGRTPLGLDDMAGNVWEWTSSTYAAPQRISRGGSWYEDDPDFVRGAIPGWVEPTLRDYDLGFRCARGK